tara:strand:- start:949 stop:1470 length:522 start_codon:yes stop_codon:yes gene_type:complete
MTFFVTGLPRSRTAWIANFLTYGDSLCYHEGLNGCNSMKEYQDKLEGNGDSNTYLAVFDYNKYFPNAKKIIIDSDVDKAIEFSREVCGTDVTKTIVKYKESLDAMEGLHIPLKKLNNSLGEIWNYVYDEQFNKKRSEMLIDLNVQMLDPHAIDLQSLSSFNKSISNSIVWEGF